MKNPTRFLMRVPVPWVFVLTYFVGVALEFVLPTPRFTMVARMSTIAGAVVFTLGALIAGWGLMIFYRARTTTVPGRSSVKLVTWGPYRFTRNPMYVGLTIAYVGEALLQKQFWPVVVLPLMIAYLNWTVIPVEEANLDEVFPDEYAEFRSRVRRWI